MDTPIVSIIIPCYKQAAYLPEALDSILAQTYPHWECMVVDDASPDDTAAVVHAYKEKDPRIGLHRLKQNSGLPAARNAGIQNTRAPYIVPLDADDMLHPDFLATTLNILIHARTIKVVYCDTQHFGINHDYMTRPDVDMAELCRRNLFQPTALFRRSDFEKTAGYRPGIFGYEDWDMWLQLINEPKDAVRVPEGLFYQRIKEQSMITELRDNTTLERKVRKQIYLYNRKKMQSYVPELAYWYEKQFKNKDLEFLAGYKLGRAVKKVSSFVR
jgi:glycosyltransferase involved in cell wall biosynthesis